MAWSLGRTLPQRRHLRLRLRATRVQVDEVATQTTDRARPLARGWLECQEDSHSPVVGTLAPLAPLAPLAGLAEQSEGGSFCDACGRRVVVAEISREHADPGRVEVAPGSYEPPPPCEHVRSDRLSSIKPVYPSRHALSGGPDWLDHQPPAIFRHGNRRPPNTRAITSRTRQGRPSLTAQQYPIVRRRWIIQQPRMRGLLSWDRQPLFGVSSG